MSEEELRAELRSLALKTVERAKAKSKEFRPRARIPDHFLRCAAEEIFQALLQVQRMGRYPVPNIKRAP